MSSRLLSFVIWALVLASAAYWASKFMVRTVPVPPQAGVVGAAAVPAVGLTRLFGAPVVQVAAAAPVPVVADARFKLIGVMAPRAGQRSGLALIAVDDKPARAVPLGGQVEGSLVVLAISHRQVDLGPKGGAATTSLSLPALPEAARGVPSAMAGFAPPGLPIAAPPALVPTMPMAPMPGRPFGAGQAQVMVPQLPPVQLEPQPSLQPR